MRRAGGGVPEEQAAPAAVHHVGGQGQAHQALGGVVGVGRGVHHVLPGP